MKTFEELKKEITPEFIKKLCELPEGFEVNNCDTVFMPLSGALMFDIDCYEKSIIIFPLILHRAVEGWNRNELNKVQFQNLAKYIWIREDMIELKNMPYKKYDFKNYQPCHLTRCEMAILDCLLEVLK